MYQNIFISGWSEHQKEKVFIWDDVLGLITEDYSNYRYAYKPDPQGKYTSMYGGKLTKVRKFDRDDSTLFESDLSRETRVLTDRYLDSDEPSTGHRVLILDIETDSTGDFPNVATADKTITAIANYRKDTDEYVVFILDPSKTVPTDTQGNITTVSCPTEDDLLMLWLGYYEDAAPTILTGWNLDGFDIPYIIHRLNRLYGEGTAGRLSPIGIVSFNDRRERYMIAGVSVLDYLPVYKKYTYTQLPSYRLDAVAKHEVGVGKIEYDGTLNDLYAADINKFIEYNVHDVRLVKMIDDKMQLIELIRFICHLGHVPYEDYGYSSKYIEGAIITYLHRKGIIASNKPAGGREAFDSKMAGETDKFAGAYVKAPVPGLYEWVYSLDLTSLYPSIIMSLNISPDTKVASVSNWNVDQHMKKEMDTYNVVYQKESYQLSRDKFNELLRTEKYNISSNGILYSTEKVGVIPEILDVWFDKRVEFKNEMKKHAKAGNKEMTEFYDRRQLVQKIMLNCFSPDTEVVTPRGIRNIQSLNVGDEVYSINPETGLSEIKHVTRTYAYDYEGDMVEFKSTHVDFLTTPNHRFLLSDANDAEGHYRWLLSGDVMNIGTRQYLPMKRPLPGKVSIDTIDISEFYTGTVVVKNGKIRDDRPHTRFQPIQYNMNDWLEFMGWYTSEGSSYVSTRKEFDSGNVRGETFTLHIAQEKYHSHVKSLLDRMGINYYESVKGFTIASKVLHNILTGECGMLSPNKKLPRWVFDLSPEQLHHLYTGLMMGDGDLKGDRYSTNSSQLAADVTELALRLGKQAFVIPDGKMYRVQINASRGVRPCIKPENKKLIPYSGKVYCVEVADNHTLLAGRNGKYNWVGQSIYGVLGLSIFRFYDLDNALAVTATGQDVIKTSAKYINSLYCKETGVKEDYCIYIDTDSVYFSAQPIVKDLPTWEEKKQRTIELARDHEDRLNKFYDVMAKQLFNCDTHRFSIKGEAIAETAFWTGKKRYAMKHVYDLETNLDVVKTKPKVKGFDVVRSSFPPAFQKFMSEALWDILCHMPKEVADAKILSFKKAMKDMPWMSIARNTGVNNVSEYDTPKYKTITEFAKGATAHSKAAVTYNRMLRLLGLDKQYLPIRNGDKIKWTKLKENPYGIPTLALKTYDDPPELVKLMEEYLDHDALFADELEKKLDEFYSAMGWGRLPTQVNQNAHKFFTFNK